MRRLRSQSALQDNFNVLQAVNLNKVSKKTNAFSTAEKKLDTNTIVGHRHLNVKTKASNGKTNESNKENFAVENNETNTLKTACSRRKQVLKRKAKCALKKDETDGHASPQSREDSVIGSDPPSVEPEPKKSDPSHLENTTTRRSTENDGIEKKRRIMRPRNNNLKVANKQRVAIVEQLSLEKAGTENCGKIKIVKKKSIKVGQNKLKETWTESKLKMERDHVKKEIVQNEKYAPKLCGSFKNYKINSYFEKKPASPKSNLLPKHYPIWKKEPQLTSKRKSEYDVYDILQDEDMASETPVKAKKRRVPNKARIKIKKPSKPEQKKSINIEKDTKDKISDVPDIDSDEILMNLPKCEMEAMDDNSETVLASPSKLMPGSLGTAPDTVVSNLLKELDESFPKTSTPQKSPFEKKLHLPSRNLGEETSTFAELSCIPNTNSHNLVGAVLQTPNVSPKRNIQQKKPICNKKSELKYDFEVNLFESPPKDLGKKNNVKRPRKMVLDLTDTKCKLMSDEPNSSLLKPRKSYLSPDVLTKHIAKTKRASIAQNQKPVQKSRQELLIEKMNKEFDDISNLELCIE